MEREDRKIYSDKRRYNNYQKDLDGRLQDFEEEIDGLSDKFERKMDEAGRRFEKRYYETFGFLGPLLFSLLSLLFLIIAIWVIGYFGDELNSSISEQTADFLIDNLALFFGLMILFNYGSYLNKRYNKLFKWIYPFVNALAVTLVLWILSRIFEIINTELGIEIIDSAAQSIQENLLIIYVLLLLLSYVIMLSKLSIREPIDTTKKTKRQYYQDRYIEGIDQEDIGQVKRLYRSGRDKILGGICGGLGEYLDVDPVVIRILWVIGAFASFGTAVVLYIILWIVIPRNPKDRWD